MTAQEAAALLAAFAQASRPGDLVDAVIRSRPLRMQGATR
jgi:hypothetical protein